MNPVSRQFSNLGLLVRYRLGERNKLACEDKIFFFFSHVFSLTAIWIMLLPWVGGQYSLGSLSCFVF